MRTSFPNKIGEVISTFSRGNLPLASLLSSTLFFLGAHAAPPLISNLNVAQRAGEKSVDITYDLAADAPVVTISLEISADGGAKYNVPATSATGAVGAGVQPGLGKTITWNAGADWNLKYSEKMRFRLRADDHLAPTPLLFAGASEFFTVTTGRGVTRYLELVNTGAAPVIVTGVQFPVGFSGDWVGTIPPGATQTIPVTFAPPAIGSFKGDLRVLSPGVEHARHPLIGTGAAPIRGIAFQDKTSDLLAVLLPAAANEPSVAILRKTGNSKRAFFVFPDGGAVEMETDPTGRLARVVVDGHRFVFSEYTTTTAKLTYHKPDGSQLNEIVSLSAPPTSLRARAVFASAASSSEPAAAEEQAARDEVDDTLEFMADGSKTHLLLNIYRIAGEYVYQKIQKAREKTQELLNDAEKIAVVAKNKVVVASDKATEAAKVLAERAGLFVEELRQIDPKVETTAAFEVTETSVQPLRNEWDQLMLEKKVDLSFTMTEVSCDESVFADMNPECPQYVAPVPLTAQNLAFTMFSDEKLNRVLKPSTAATYVSLVKEPTNGLLTAFNPASGAFSYIPNANFIGEDRFTYVAANRLGISAEATVVITVKKQTCKNEVYRGTDYATYYRTCSDSFESATTYNNKKPSGYERYEIHQNSPSFFYLNMSGYSVAFKAEGAPYDSAYVVKREYDDSKRLVYEEEHQWDASLQSIEHTITTRTVTYGGAKKQTDVVQKTWSGSSLTTRTWKEIGTTPYTDYKKTTVPQTEPLLTKSSVEAFAASFMQKADLSVGGMKSSVAYQLYLVHSAP